jgi:hypothetical protein
MTRQIARILVAALLSLSVSIALAGNTDSEVGEKEWNFRVFLDDSEIGYHNFSLVEKDGRRRLVTEAEFEVRFLFFTAYRYEHVNEETWQGECLQEIRSETDANGRLFEVRGVQEDGGLEIETGNTTRDVPGCVKTFAYWNPDILDEPELLNSQTGELLKVEIEPVATETLNVRGEEIAARRYRLLAKNMELDIWYSRDQGRWLALESTVKGGRKLRYELS